MPLKEEPNLARRKGWLLAGDLAAVTVLAFGFGLYLSGPQLRDPYRSHDFCGGFLECLTYTGGTAPLLRQLLPRCPLQTASRLPRQGCSGDGVNVSDSYGRSIASVRARPC